MACKEFVTLPNGAKLPLFGIGTWAAKEQELEAALDQALEAGYRHIDTAALYENEEAIGNVLKSWFDQGKLKREDIFLTTKLPFAAQRPSSVVPWLTRSLKKLRLDYVDLYLAHFPCGVQERGEELMPKDEDGNLLMDYTTDLLAIWKEMEAQVDAGRAKAIGVSNYNQNQIQRILDNCRIKPANLQTEIFLYMWNQPLVDYCHKNGITVTAYSTLGSPGNLDFLKSVTKKDNLKLPEPLKDPLVNALAKKYKKTAGQILLRHTVQKGVSVIPKSTNFKRLVENISIFDFKISSEDMAKLDALHIGEQCRLTKFHVMYKGMQKHPEYPFPVDVDYD